MQKHASLQETTLPRLQHTPEVLTLPGLSLVHLPHNELALLERITAMLLPPSRRLQQCENWHIKKNAQEGCKC